MGKTHMQTHGDDMGGSNMRLQERREAQMLLFDALVFFIILSAATLIPSMFLRGQDMAADTGMYTTLQTQAEATLESMLQATIPATTFPASEEDTLLQHLQVGEGLQLEAQGLEDGTERERYGSFEAAVALLLSNTISLGNEARIQVEREDMMFSIGPEPPTGHDIASAKQVYEGTGVEVTILLWRR
ncbi:MAG: hypothetical protein KAT70_09985 [Thermoplasmata archaeon]|nr:hypothetical protein [Thermoplasmata archaeon]